MMGEQRSVTHSEHEDVRDLVCSEMQTPMFQRSMRLRRGVERLFADAKGRRSDAAAPSRGLPTTMSYRPRWSSLTKGPRLPSLAPGSPSSLARRESLTAKIIKAKFVDWLWLRIEFDRDEVKRECGETQRLLVDVEACDLAVENLAQALGVGPLAIGPPQAREKQSTGKSWRPPPDRGCVRPRSTCLAPARERTPGRADRRSVAGCRSHPPCAAFPAHGYAGKAHRLG